MYDEKEMYFSVLLNMLILTISLDFKKIKKKSMIHNYVFVEKTMNKK